MPGERAVEPLSTRPRTWRLSCAGTCARDHSRSSHFTLDADPPLVSAKPQPSGLGRTTGDDTARVWPSPDPWWPCDRRNWPAMNRLRGSEPTMKHSVCASSIGKPRNITRKRSNCWSNSSPTFLRILPHRQKLAAVYNDLAWFLVTSPDPQLWDPPHALELAKMALRQTPECGRLLANAGRRQLPNERLERLPAGSAKSPLAPSSANRLRPVVPGDDRAPLGPAGRSPSPVSPIPGLVAEATTSRSPSVAGTAGSGTVVGKTYGTAPSPVPADVSFLRVEDRTIPPRGPREPRVFDSRQGEVL